MKKSLAFVFLLVLMASPATAQMHGSGAVEIPLRVENGRLLVPIQAADGTEMVFMLSTVTPTVLSASTAALDSTTSG